MSSNSIYSKIGSRIKNIVCFILFQYFRILKYKFLSSCKKIEGKPRYNQPVLINGAGEVFFGNNVNLGVKESPGFYTTYSYIGARSQNSKIILGNNCWINNNFSFISEGEGIEIGNDVLMGINVEISDSDFHDLNPSRRFNGNVKTAKVVIEDNVFIGSNVKILKGVVIGKNSVIAASSVVTRSIPENVIAGGYPCKIIRTIELN